MPKKRTIESYLRQFNLTEEYLRESYLIKKLSLPEIQKEKGIGFKACSALLRHFNIPVRTISESRKTDVAREKIKQSFIVNLGVENPSQLPSVKEQKRKTFLKHYGVDNIWKSKKYYEWLNDYMLGKYGCKRFASPDVTSKTIKNWWRTLSPEEKEKKIREQLKNLHKSSTLRNNIEAKVAQSLDYLNVSYERYFHVGRYVADFYVKSFNLIIECNGDFWHANPTKYKASDTLKFPGKPILASELWGRDKKKIDEYRKRGYSTLTLWETDVKQMFTNQTLSEHIMEHIKNESGFTSNQS